jgi:phospholipid N-methyltransferase
MRGISLMPKEKKTALLRDIYELLKPGGAFVSYQVTRELNRYAREVFDAIDSEHCWLNVPPMYVNCYGKKLSA